MKKISVLDVTMRDGGCVNDFNFGQKYMEEILRAQEASGVEYIELGYLDTGEGSECGRTKYKNEEAIIKYFLTGKKSGITYLAMMDYGKFDPGNLPERSEDTIDGIRLAFHKKDKDKVPELGRIIIDKGYQLFVQPMITLRYSDSELLSLIEKVNTELPDASGFYIVDSFGEMRPNDMERMINLVDHNLIPTMMLGFHSHNNLQLSYSNAMSLLQFHTDRRIILDSSIMGMGKGAGNLNTELLLEHINLYYGGHYNIAPLLEVIDSCISVLHKEYNWGYSPEYYLSSVNHCTPTYAGYLYEKHRLRIDQIGEVLASFSEDKRISFDKAYAEKMYRKYNERNAVDDIGSVEKIYDSVSGKRVLIIAPGKTIASGENQLRNLDAEGDVITISLNAVYGFETDFVLVTRPEAVRAVTEMKRNTQTGKILLSNIAGSEVADSDTLVIDYSKWILADDETRDSSGVICLNLLKNSNATKLMLAGFDGFTSEVNDNYSDPTMRRALTEKKAEDQNRFFSDFVEEIRKYKTVEFVTPTRYEV